MEKNMVHTLWKGMFVGSTMLVPGVSGGSMAMILGIYETVVEAIGSFRLGILIPFGVGILLGIILTTKFLEMAMIRYPQPTYLMILGFVLGSVTEIFPRIPRGIEWVICILMLVAGYGIIRLISQAGTEETENR